ncbi:uncharacterized protein LY89DRAFT_161057 [Mollisia scopiformis]|uniref:Uncharacterized protein n=1 Tax=Mollisia scopiformis TaxID=149040 RepID=A0A194XRW4_MOLSC|nr:uncharacterized protein LY89DRAFT_161057 [Mollisia scopiformis]KUJ22933.1 hypothetical protein LY89DRAFT_161057 [Mollisia scopiformis]
MSRTYIERDSRGRERLVLSRTGSYRRSSSQGRIPLRDLLDEAEVREEALTAEVRSLQLQLSESKRSEWHLQNLRIEHQKVVNEHYGCRHMQAQLEAQGREVRKVEALLAQEEDRNDKLMNKNERLEEKIRLMKRGSREGEGLREGYEQKVLEVEVLRQRLVERDVEIRDAAVRLRLAETRLVDKNETIIYLKDYLRSKGFRVD